MPNICRIEGGLLALVVVRLLEGPEGAHATHEVGLRAHARQAVAFRYLIMVRIAKTLVAEITSRVAVENITEDLLSF